MTPSTRRRAGRILWMAASAFVAAGTLTPSDQPAVGAAFCVICGDLAAVDIFLNIAAFVPIGAGLALEGVRAWRALPMTAAASLLIETLQLFSIPGRDASVADVFSNSLGAAIGFALAARATQWLLPGPARGRALAAGWLVFWLVIQAVGAYALRQRPTAATYHGQIARALSGRPRFPGLVREPRVNGEPLPDHVLPPPQAARLRAALSSRATVRVEAVVVIDTPPPWPSPIVRIADRRENEILLLASQGQDLVASIRTNAARLRLRPFRYRLRRAFAADAPGAQNDTTRSGAAFSPERVDLHASSAGTTRVASIPLTPASFWRLFAPVTVYAEDSRGHTLMNAAWMFLTILPLGYWWYRGRDAGEGDAERARAAAAIVPAAAIAVGWFAIPFVAGVALFTVAETLALVAGLATGALLARATR